MSYGKWAAVEVDYFLPICDLCETLINTVVNGYKTIV